MSFSNKRQICTLFPNYLHSKDTKCQRCIYIYIYLAAKNIQLEISPARDLNLQLEIHISSQRYIYTARDIHLQQEIYISSQRYISPARDIYFELDIYISSQRYISSKIDIYLQLEIDIQIVSKKLILQNIVFVLDFQWLTLSNCKMLRCLFPTRDRYVKFFLIICILRTLKARGIYLAAQIIQLQISQARDIYLQLEIYLYISLLIEIYISS